MSKSLRNQIVRWMMLAGVLLVVPASTVFAVGTSQPSCTEVNRSDLGIAVDPNGLGIEVDPNGLGIEVDPNGLGIEVDPNGLGIEVDPNGLGIEVDPNCLRIGSMVG